MSTLIDLEQHISEERKTDFTILYFRTEHNCVRRGHGVYMPILGHV